MAKPQSSSPNAAARPASHWEDETPPPRKAHDVASSFTGAIPPRRLPGTYIVALAACALVMILLPLIYLAFVGAIGVALFFHATENLSVFETYSSIKTAVFLYVAPLVVGLVAMFFMLKPLLAPRAPRFREYSIEPFEAPALYTLVQHVAARVGAPNPKRIDVNLSINASAGFRRGLLSLLLGGDLVLTIGLPLIGALSTRELGGIIAHELGHFRQGAGMRLSYIVYSINHWFARVVYQRDAWDEGLRQATSKGGHAIIIVIGLLAQLAVWISRRLLWVLMKIGDLVSSFLSRAMEFDADYYEAHLAGSRVFGRTSVKLHCLSVAQASADGAVARAFREGRLPDNLADLPAAIMAGMPDHAVAQVKQRIRDERQRLFDSHPPTAKRIRVATELHAPGVFHLDQPARFLLENYEMIGRAATIVVYRENLGGTPPADRLVPASSLVMGAREAREARHAADAFFAPRLLDVRGPHATPEFRAIKPISDEPRLIARADKARRQMTRGRSQLLEALDRYAQARATIANIGVARTLGPLAPARVVRRVTGLEPRPDLLKTNELEAQDAVRNVEHAVIEPFERAASLRLETALRLLRSPAVTKAMPDAAQLVERAATLLDVLAGLREIAPGLDDLGITTIRLRRLFEQIGDASPTDNEFNAAVKLGHDAHRRIASIRSRLVTMVYPFEHATEGISVASFALGLEPPRDHPAACLAAASELGSGIADVLSRAMSELVTMALRVEDAVLPALAVAPKRATEPSPVPS